jgi:hypothetical protein
LRSEEVVFEVAWTEAEGRGVSGELILRLIREIGVVFRAPKGPRNLFKAASGRLDNGDLALDGAVGEAQ